MANTATPFNIFEGHLGHLSTAQEDALAAFKLALVEAKLYEPAQPSPDDPTLLRFLRARSWDTAGALKQYSDHVAWRQKHDVDNTFASFETAEFENGRRGYSSWTGRRDKNGVPIYVFRLATMDSAAQKALNAAPAERRYQRIVVLCEAMVRFVMPLCSALPHTNQTPITCVTTIVDLKGLSFGLMWSLRSHLSESITLASANYPETLSTIVIVNAPSFFPTIWGWINGWFDPGTRNKIHILGKNPTEKLLELFDAENLPRAYGGTLDWEFYAPPILDAAATAAIGTMPEGPAIFVDDKVVRP
ncbi:CRAL/TRIO domain-containing protein [Mycena rosella]|uniref:CRAL/TRIO domain-containing protein n=1 Tax=Mycena rosella TaxID=1033263 RepID=A0AAD7CQQ7_MYCRO|nr:CRAL/TRIO domain-containing protein [Mycena rosella]